MALPIVNETINCLKTKMYFVKTGYNKYLSNLANNQHSQVNDGTFFSTAVL